MKSLLIYLLAFLTPALTSAEEAAVPTLPSASQRSEMLKTMASEMQRLDGEALLVRGRSRARTFESVTEQLNKEALEASSWTSLLRAFARLNFAYPNLHSKFNTGRWYPQREWVRPVIGFGPEWLSNGTTDYRVSRVSPGHFTGENAPRSGDLLLAINGRSIQSWQEEHFEFCKWPLRGQCDLEFFSEFRNEILDWTRDQPLSVTLERNGHRWEVAVPLEPRPAPVQNNPDLCGKDHELYPDFSLVHEGRFACLYKQKSHPGTALLRISSFLYSRGDAHPIDSMEKELEGLWGWWEKNSRGVEHLVIDLASNGGGNEPIPYYAILFQRPFQELFVRFKKVAELENPKLRRETFFWGEPAQETWFQNIRREGIWSATPWGEFLPQLPMFCAGEPDCRNGLFPVQRHGFQGRVTLVLNHWCVSSCDGFAYGVKQELGSRVRVVGQPQSADSAYSRVTINMLLDPSQPKGFRTEIVPLRDESSKGSLLSQTVTVTRSVDSSGRVVSGLPLEVERFVPWTFDQDERDWRRTAVKAAIGP